MFCIVQIKITRITQFPVSLWAITDIGDWFIYNLNLTKLLNQKLLPHKISYINKSLVNIWDLYNIYIIYIWCDTVKCSDMTNCSWTYVADAFYFRKSSSLLLVRERQTSLKWRLSSRIKLLVVTARERYRRTHATRALISSSWRETRVLLYFYEQVLWTIHCTYMCSIVTPVVDAMWKEQALLKVKDIWYVIVQHSKVLHTLPVFSFIYITLYTYIYIYIQIYKYIYIRYI